MTAVLDAPIRVPPDTSWPLIIVISGGQTGADQGGLRAARATGYRTGGMAPKGWRTDDGPAPWLADYGLVEGPHHSYAPRTEWNARNSTGTLWFGDHRSPGGITTDAACVRYNRVWQVIEPMGGSDRTNPMDFAETIPALIRRWILDHQIITLNVAGNRERLNPGIGARTDAILRAALNRLTPHTGGTPHAT